MTYYRITKDNQIIGVADSTNFVKYFAPTNMLLPSDREEAHFLMYNNKLYRDTWMMPLPEREYNYISVNIFAVSQEEYLGYLNTLTQSPEPIAYEPEPEPEIEPYIPEPDITVVQARELKIKQFSLICQRNIENGFDFMGSHYSMTTQDQLNLLSAQVELINGALTVRYHADGEQYRDVPASEMAFIIEEAFIHKDAELRYFEQMKQLINEMENVVDILNMQYEG